MASIPDENSAVKVMKSVKMLKATVCVHIRIEKEMLSETPSFQGSPKTFQGSPKTRDLQDDLGTFHTSLQKF